MTSVVILAAVDRQKRPLLFAVSKEMPSKWSMEQLAHTATRFFGKPLAPGVDPALMLPQFNVVLRKTVACDACGCCDVFPCRKGCGQMHAPTPGKCVACAPISKAS